MHWPLQQPVEFHCLALQVMAWQWSSRACWQGGSLGCLTPMRMVGFCSHLDLLIPCDILFLAVFIIFGFWGAKVQFRAVVTFRYVRLRDTCHKDVICSDRLENIP